jgi:putative membrane protein
VSLRELPGLNALLNSLAAALLLAGFLAIRTGRRRLHAACMLSAVSVSVLFLVSYLVYHFQVGAVRFQGHGPIRTLYFAILLTHTILAVVIVPLVATTLLRALRRRFPAHRRIARLTLPLWAYVSVTGVVVYLMLFRM